MALIIKGVGSALPVAVQSNDALSQILDTSDEWIKTRTGIEQRWIASGEECTSTLAVEAGRRALNSAGCGDVDLVLVATCTPDRSVPATAPLVASYLELGSVPAFDLNAVCSGFVYALAAAHGFLASIGGKRALVIGADTFSTILDPNDRVTRSIFGDGAGAVVIEVDQFDAPCILGSDGTGYDLISRPCSGSAMRRETGQAHLEMDGKPVFMSAVKHMVESCHEVLRRSHLEVCDLDAFVAHQANARILNTIKEQLDMPAELVVSNIARVGNTVAASIPLALEQAHRDGKLHQGGKVLLTAFGGGLTWGASIIEWQVPQNESSTETQTYQKESIA